MSSQLASERWKLPPRPVPFGQQPSCQDGREDWCLLFQTQTQLLPHTHYRLCHRSRGLHTLLPGHLAVASSCKDFSERASCGLQDSIPPPGLLVLGVDTSGSTDGWQGHCCEMDNMSWALQAAFLYRYLPVGTSLMMDNKQVKS